MAATHPVDLPVRWHLSVQADGTGKLTFEGELDAESTAVARKALQTELQVIKVRRFEIDVRQLVCDSAGLALLYCLATGGMTPGRIILDKLCAHSSSLGTKTSTALMAAWDADLCEIHEGDQFRICQNHSVNQQVIHHEIHTPQNAWREGNHPMEVRTETV